MSALIGALRVSLSAETANFEAGMKRAQRQTKDSATAIQKSLSSIKTELEALAAGFTVGFLAEQIKKSLDYAGSLKEVSQTLGVTTKDLQTFRFAAGQSGVAQDQLEVGLRRLTVSMGKAELGSQAQIKAFNAIGISLNQLKGKTTGDVFRLMADGLSKVTDRAQRAAIEMILMGRSGSQLDNLLAPGSKRLNELADAAQQLGIVLSDRQIQGAEETAHKLEAVKEVLSAQIAGVVADNASAILGLSSALAQLTGSIVKFLGSNPQLALGIVGALLGANVGKIAGPYGAVLGALAGGAGGAALGNNVAQLAADANTDPAFRRQQLHNARDALIRARAAPDMGGRAMPGVGVDLSGPSVADAQKEFDKQLKLAYSAAAQNARQPAPPPGTDLPKILGGGGSGRTGRAKQPPADRSDEVLAQMEKEEIQATQSILQAKLQLAGNAEERLQIAVQLIDIDKATKDAQVDEEVAKAKREKAEGKITAAALQQVEQKARILKAANAEEAAIKKQAIVEEQLAKADQANFEIADQRLKWGQDALKVADELATTAEDHRRIQLQILDSEIEQRRLELEHEKQLAIRNGVTDEQIKVIQDQIDHLATEKAQGQASIIHNTQNPLGQWAQEVPKTTQEIIESFQKIQVEGINGLADAMTSVITGTQSLKEAFGSLANQIVSDIVRMIVQMMIFRALSTALGLGRAAIPSPDLSAGTDLSSGFNTPLSSGSANIDFGSLPTFATGGSFNIMGNTGVDQNVLSLNGLPIARVSHGERIDIANGGRATMPPPVQIVTHIDATGADPAELSRVRGAVEQLNAELPYRVVQAWYDAYSRNVIRP